MRESAKSNALPNIRVAVSAVGFVLIGLAGACGGDGVTAPEVEACGPAPYFTVLPVPAARIVAVPVVGGVDAPGHTLPTDHGAFFLDGPDIPVKAPGDITITALRRNRYSGGGEPPGTEDYAIYFQVCRELTGWFGHVAALAPGLAAQAIEWDECRTYSTPFTTIEACSANVNIDVRAGAEVATGSFVVDIGMEDTRVTNFYISPQRLGGPSHAICMWAPWDDANRAVLFTKLRDLRRPDVTPTGEPRCGTMEVDVPSTAKGVWVDPAMTGPIQADETDVMALVDYPYRPQMELALSLGPESLGARLAVVERRTSGRVNRAFEDVTQDGLIYCYGPTVPGFAPSSWLVQLTSATALRLEHIDHAAGASPCNADPATWSFGPAAVTMIR